MPSSVSYVESQSSLTQRRKQWLATLISSVMFSLFVGSVLGFTLSALAFSGATDIGKPGYAITQSFVLFASMLSLFYIPLHVIASHKGEGLYLDPPIPSFCHEVHARTTLVMRMAIVMWASAIVGLALNISRQEGGMDSSTVIHLDLDMFACAAGFLSGSVLLLVLHFATRPFALPWITPQPVSDEDASTRAGAGGGSSAFEDDEKSSGSSSTDSSTLCGTPPASSKRSKAAATSAITTTPPPSDASSSASSRARNMTRTRRYVLEAPTPVPLSSPASSGSSSGSSGSGEEESSLPSTSDPGSLSAASTAASLPEQPGKKGADKKGEGRPVTPETECTGGSGGKGAARQGPQRPPAIAAAWVRRRPANNPSMFRFRSKSVPQPVRDVKEGAGDGGGSGQTAPGQGAAVPPEPSPAAPPPPPTYYVPGSWIFRGPCEEGEEEEV